MSLALFGIHFGDYQLLQRSSKSSDQPPLRYSQRIVIGFFRRIDVYRQPLQAIAGFDEVFVFLQERQGFVRDTALTFLYLYVQAFEVSAGLFCVSQLVVCHREEC